MLGSTAPWSSSTAPGGAAGDSTSRFARALVRPSRVRHEARAPHPLHVAYFTGCPSSASCGRVPAALGLATRASLPASLLTAVPSGGRCARRAVQPARLTRLASTTCAASAPRPTAAARNAPLDPARVRRFGLRVPPCAIIRSATSLPHQRFHDGVSPISSPRVFAGIGGAVMVAHRPGAHACAFAPLSYPRGERRARTRRGRHAAAAGNRPSAHRFLGELFFANLAVRVTSAAPHVVRLLG